MKHFYFSKLLVGMVFILVAQTYLTAQNNIQDVVLNGQAFKKITGTISVDQTLDNTSLWIIEGTVTVDPMVTLTILQGTQIFAETQTTEIKVDPLGLVDWQGTSTEPIVFDTLANAPGQGAGNDSPGQWYGITIEGNGAGSNSGTVRYVRIMYAGFVNMDDGENAFKLESVGSSTTIEYVQVYKNANRSVRMDGGDVNLKYIISTNSEDVGFRFDNDAVGGWTGSGQFWIVNRDFLGETTAIESRDGSTPTLSNITVTGVGFNNPGSTPTGDDGGIRVRDDGDAQIYNTVVTGVVRAIRIDNSDGITNGTSLFANSAAFNNVLNSGTGFHSTTSVFNPTNGDYDPMFNNSVTPFTIVDSYVGTSTTNSTTAGPLDAFFTDVNFIGAVEDGNDWTVDWCLNLDGTLRGSSLSVNNFDIKDVKVYPNPVRDELVVNSEFKISNITLYNTLGRKVYENSSLINGENKINMSQFQQGIYFLRLSSGDTTQTLKVIKR